MNDSKVVALVDAYAPTRGLAAEFSRRGFSCVRVQSTPEPPPVYRGPFDMSVYADNIVHDGDIDHTVDALRRHDPALVITGGELGVEFADVLSETMGLLSNGTAKSEARRDKFRQLETVRAAGLRVARHTMATDEEKLAAWHEEVGGRIVVKPARSAAGDGVKFCDTPTESVAALRDLLGADNIFSGRNDAVVAQEYLVGSEYIVDMVSRDGVHHVTDIWRYEKLAVNDRVDLTAGMLLMPRRGEIQDQLATYAFRVLDSLDIAHGPSHMEIKLTPDGPCLVEVGARIAGLDLPSISTLAMQDGQLEWTVDALTDPDRFHARVDTDYELSVNLAVVCLVSPFDGVLAEYPLLDQVKALESFHALHQTVAPGQRIRRTVDDMGWPMSVTLRHPLLENVLRDGATVRYLDGPGFYRLAEDQG